MIERVAHFVIKYRLRILIVCLLLTGFFAYQMTKVELATRFGDLLPQNHPYVKIHNEFRERFGGANILSVAVGVREGDIFNVETLRKIDRITRDIELIPGAHHYQIVSIARSNVKDIRATAWGLEIEPVMWPDVPKTPEGIANLKRIIYTNDTIRGPLVSIDGKSALITADFYEGRIDHRVIFKKVREICEREEDSNTFIYVAGEPMLYGWVYHHFPQIVKILILTAIVVLALLFLYIRSWGAMLVPLSSIVVGIIWGLGFAGLVGFNFDPLILVVPVLISARAASHSVQMVQRYYNEYDRLGEVIPAVKASFVGIFTPGVLSMVTDVFGILCIAVTPIPVIQKLAYIGTVWVISLVVGGLIFDPIILSYLPPPKRFKKREVGIMDKFLARVGAWPSGRIRWAILGVALIMLSFGVTYTRNLTVGDPRPGSPVLWPSSSFNQDVKRIGEVFPGTEQMYIVVKGKKPGIIKSSAVLRKMESFQRFMEQSPEVGGTVSISDVVPRVNMSLHEGEPKWEILPRDERYAGVLFYMFRAASQPGDLDRFASYDYTDAQITVFYKDHRSKTIRDAIYRAKKFVAENPMEELEFKLAGGLIGVLAASNESIARSQALNLAIIFFAVFLFCALTYRSIFAGFLFIISLVLANLLAYGFMAIREIGLNVNTLPVAALGIGLGVDYGLYIVSRIRERFRISKDLKDAISTAITTAGRAVFFTATTLSIGVALWYISPLRFQAEMGLLLAIIMMTNMLGGMLLLPTIIYLIKPEFVCQKKLG